MTVKLTASQARAMGIQPSPPDKKKSRKRAPQRKAGSNRKLTYCAICGEYIPLSPGTGQSHGWARNLNGWAKGYKIGAMAPYCHDCYINWFREWYEGIPQI